MFVDVALNLPLEGLFSYAVPPALQEHAQRGYRVVVPFRNKLEVGVVMRVYEERPAHLKRIRAINDVLDRETFLPEALLQLTEWIARYYHAEIGESVHLAVPSVLAPPKSQAHWVRTDVCVEDKRSSDDERGGTPTPTDMTSDSLTLIAKQVLQRLAAETVEHAQLRAEFPELRNTDLEQLEEAGFIRLENAGKDRKARTDLILRRTEAPVEKHLGENQARVIEFLDAHAEVWLSELRDLYQTSRATVRSLESRGLIRFEEVTLEYDPFGHSAIQRRLEDPVLTSDQQRAVDAIVTALHEDAPQTFLLHGVTGSGKTEVYVRAIRAARAQGRRAMVLLPEIALTPQFIQVLRGCLHEEMAVVHSQLTPAQRRSQWRRVRSGDIGVVVGARSALFAPIENLGLILVDEEHDGSFKQHEGVRYHARDAALVLAKQHGATVVLGSATPSLETLNNARKGRFGLLEMPVRVAGRPMPDIELIDLRSIDPSSSQSYGTVISDQLVAALRRTVDAGEQAILFLNRRGFAPEVRCTECGEALNCVDCERAMTYHQRGHVMMCHHCGRSAPCPPACPSCSARSLERMGAGTERLESSLSAALDGMRVGRLDRDTSRARTMETVLDAFRAGELDVLVGTQMVTKGHDFPRVTLVGVLAGDQSLSFADFRGGERTFQLLTQVAGRAGRGELPGKVLIQTWKPDHPILQAVVRGDYQSMAGYELRARQRGYLPPFGFVVLLRFHSTDYGALVQAAQRLHGWLVHQGGASVMVGPAVDAPIPKVRDKFRMQIMVHSQQRAPLHAMIPALKAWVRDDAWLKAQRDFSWSIDVDPQSLS